MIKGVSEKEYSIIKNILKDYPYQFFAYGSRTRGDFSELSDLDVLIMGNNNENTIPELKRKFDESYLPYVVNFVDFNLINDSFYNLIKNDLVKL